MGDPWVAVKLATGLVIVAAAIIVAGGVIVGVAVGVVLAAARVQWRFGMMWGTVSAFAAALVLMWLIVFVVALMFGVSQ